MHSGMELCPRERTRVWSAFRLDACLCRVLHRVCLLVPSQTSEKFFFFAGGVTLGSPIIRFIVEIVRCGPAVDRRPKWRVRSGLSGRGRSWSVVAIRALSVPPRPRRRTSVVRVEAAHLAIGRRPALVHRRVAAPIVRRGSESDDVQANGISRIISLSLRVPRC